MGGDPGKVMRNMKGAAQKYLGVGFLLGFFLVLLTYFTVSEQFAITAPNAVRRASPGHAHPSSSPITPAVEEKRQQQAPVIEEKSPKAETEEKPPKAVHEAQENPPRVEVEEPLAETEMDQQQPVADDDDGSRRSSSIVGGDDIAPAKKPACDIQGPWAADVCDIDGDVRIHGSAGTVMIVPSIESGGGNPNPQEWRIRPYSRKHQAGIKEVTVRELASAADAPACDVRSPVPAMVLAMGGLTGNYWHDFSDVLVPLFAASRRYKGEVLFLVSNIQPWWLGKYEPVVRALSRYDAVDLDRDTRVRCFRHLTVGLRLHKELTIVPDLLAPGSDRPSPTMADFTAFLRETYALPRGVPAIPTTERKPRLLLIHRAHYRRFVNVPEIRRAAESAGFEVTVASPRGDAPVEETARTVNAHDVLLGVHGAGLTNAVFLPEGAVVIQVVPYGRLERMARTDFGEPVADMGLRYLEYSVAAEESTLLEMLGRDHPVIKDPESVHRGGWDKVAEYYLGKQDVRIDVDRFAPTLAQAMDHLQHRHRQQ